MKISTKSDNWELLIVMVAIMTPFFLMAGDLKDLDEVMKSATGVAFVGAVIAIYRIWKGSREPND